MRKINRIIGIALIFKIIEAFLGQSSDYSSNTSYLRALLLFGDKTIALSDVKQGVPKYTKEDPEELIDMLKRLFPKDIAENSPLCILDVGTGKIPDFCYKINN